jgi:hypothetical protein
MNDRWEYSKAKYSDTEIHFGNLIENALGKLYPNIGANVAININLYVFISKHLNKSDEKLAELITKQGKVVFSSSEIKDIKNKIQSHLKYFNFGRVQKGGAVDETRNGFWDKIIRKITTPLSSKISPMGNYILWWVHILYHLEQQDIYGPLISQTLDVVTLSLPVLAEIAEEMTSKVFTMAPVPYASVAGDFVGYLVGLIFVGTAVLINNSRKHFGSAFVTALDAVPLFGEMLSLGAINLEKGANRYEINKKKMVNSVGKVSPTAGQIINYYTPDTQIHTGNVPLLDTDKINQEITTYVEKKSGLNDLQKKINSKIGDATASIGSVTNAATSALNSKIANATISLNITKKKGGYRKTAKFHRKNKS